MLLSRLIPRRRPRPAGLPHYLGGRRERGGTRTARGEEYPRAVAIGAPSMEVRKRRGGGVNTVLRRNMRDMEQLEPQELNRLRQILSDVESSAASMSRGNLSLKELRRRNHPYGHGPVTPSGRRRGGLGRLQKTRRGVSNRSIVNTQSGEFARSWSSRLRTDERGVTFYLGNRTKQAVWLAFGTRKMKPHGPFTTAMAKHLQKIDSEWLRLARLASSRRRVLMQMQEATGGNRNP